MRLSHLHSLITHATLTVATNLLIFELSAETQHSPILSFQSTYNVIESASFDLQAADAEAESKYGDLMDAKAIPNPNLIVGINTIGRDLNDDDENELTVAVSQLIELGGKREARIRYSNADQCAAAWLLEVQKNELQSELLHHFIRIAAMEEIVATTKSLHEISAKNIECSIAKEATGKTSLLDTKKTEITCRSIQLKLLKRQVELKKIKNELLSLWKDGPEDFEGVDYQILELSEPQSFDLLKERLKNNPELMAGDAGLVKRWEMIHVQKTKQVPDVALQVGVTTERFTQDPTLNVGFSVPLQVFNQNRGGVYNATHLYNQAYYTQQQLEKKLLSNLAVTHAECLASYEHALAIRDTILPHAEESYKMAEIAYKEGKYNYIDLLEAETTLFSIKQEFIEAAEEYHHKKAEILKLTGFKQ